MSSFDFAYIDCIVCAIVCARTLGKAFTCNVLHEASMFHQDLRKLGPSGYSDLGVSCLALLDGRAALHC